MRVGDADCRAASGSRAARPRAVYGGAPRRFGDLDFGKRLRGEETGQFERACGRWRASLVISNDPFCILHFLHPGPCLV